MLDLQQRLAQVGLETAPDTPASYGNATRASVEAFQHGRRLPVTGICDQQTWDALVEASYELGDRLLYFRHPMTRGDDVAELQRCLSALGFDTGRIDGIFGTLTAAALADFQTNMALPSDGICGTRTIQELRRVQARHANSHLVAYVRDKVRLRDSSHGLAGSRIAVAEDGSLGALAAALRRDLTEAGAAVIEVMHPDGSVQARSVNASGATVCLGITLLGGGSDPVVSYYAGHSYESPGGRRLAELTRTHLMLLEGYHRISVEGMSLPFLRETSMPAMLCRLSSPAFVVNNTGDIAAALARALGDWSVSPVEASTVQ